MRVLKGIKQGEAAWLKAKLGVVTGTRIKKAIAKDNLPLVDEIIAERGSQVIDDDSYTSEAMQRGKDMEPVAVRVYEKQTGLVCKEVGFGLHDTYDWLGISPDRFVMVGRKRRKGIEVKCPGTKKHVQYIRQDQIPAEYRGQVLNYFLCEPDCETVDFISYDDRFKPKPLFIKTVTREEVRKELDDLEAELIKFWNKVKSYEDKILF